MENVEFDDEGVKILTKEEWDEHLKGKNWIDFTIVNQIIDRYYIEERTGAEAIIAIWQDLKNGYLDRICQEMQIPDPLGFIHAVNTLSKHYVLDGVLNKKQSAEKWRATNRL